MTMSQKNEGNFKTLPVALNIYPLFSKLTVVAKVLALLIK